MATTKQATAAKTPSASKSTATRAPAKKTSTRKTTAKKTTAKQSAAKQASSRTSTTATTRAADDPAAAKAPLLEREAPAVIEDLGYAFAGVLVAAASRQAPRRAGRALRALRERLLEDLERGLDDKALEGRRAADRLRRSERVSVVLQRSGVSRAQVKSAVTSAARSVDAALEAGVDQLKVARSQGKGAVTMLMRTPRVVRSESGEQAGQARAKAKGAVTSLRRTAESISDLTN